MTCVVAGKFSLLDMHLGKAEIATFLEGLRAQDERVASWSPATLNKDSARCSPNASSSAGCTTARRSS